MDKQREKYNSFEGEAGDGKKKGRIGRLDEQTLGYYRRVQENLNSDFQEQEDKELFLSNVFKQLSSELLKISQNQTASSIVENLLLHANSQQCLELLNSLSSDIELACYDRFASHVTQSLLMLTWRQLSHDSDADVDALTGQVCEIYSFIVSKLALHMQHTYSSHIVRTLLEVLGGAKVSAEVIRSKVARQQHRGQTNEEFSSYKQIPAFQDMFTDLCDKLINLQKLEDHAKNYLSNPVLQTLLRVCHTRHEKLCNQISQQLIDNTNMFSAGAEKESLPEMVTHETGSHLVEQVLTVLTSNQLTLILQQLQQHVVAMALHPSANFVLKKLIQVTQSAEQFEQVYSPVSKFLEDILALNHAGVVVSLAQGCIKHSVKQSKFIKVLQKAFHCYDPPERQRKLFPLLASLTAYEVFFKLPQVEDDKDSSSEDEEDKPMERPSLKETVLHGSLLLQELLRFTNPTPILVSLLDLTTRELVTLACHPCGSRIIDVVFTSTTVGERNRNELLSRLKGNLLALACDKNGSRSVDSLWSAISVKQRTMVAKELAKHETRLRSDRFGMHVWRNWALNNFLRRPDEWKRLQEGEVRKRKMFEDIIHESEGASTKKKQKKNPLALEDNETDITAMALPTQIAVTTEVDENDEASKRKKHKKNKKGLMSSESLCNTSSIDETSIKVNKKKKKKKSSRTE